MKKTAFTIVEFVMTIIIMLLIMGATISVPLKKAKMTKKPLKKDGIINYSCTTTPAQDEYVFTIDSQNGRHEFFTVQLLGGGAAGSATKGGAAGETKVIHYPSMNGRYAVRLGKGGIATNPAKISGGNTVLYKIDDSGQYELIEFARGGLGSVEPLTPEDGPDANKGEKASFVTDGASVCGNGGDAGANGQIGEVIIRW